MSNESKPKTGNMTEEEKRKIDAASKNLLLGKRDAAAKELQSMSKRDDGEKAIALLLEHSEILDTPNTSTMPIEEYQKLFNRMEEWRARSKKFLAEITPPKAAAPKTDAKSKEDCLRKAFERHKKEVLPDNWWCDWETCEKDGTAAMVYEAMEEYANQFKPQEKTFSLNDMFECWEAGYQHCLIGAKNAENYFKEKHGIDLKQSDKQ